MKVLFDVNYPLSWAEGGFSIQIRRSKTALEALGAVVDWVDYFSETAQDADIVHYFGMPSSITMYRAARAMQTRQVVTFLAPRGFVKPSCADHVKRAVRGAALQCLGPLRLFGRMGIGIEQADAFIMLNRAEKNYAVFHYGWPESKCHVIPEGVDGLFFDETIPAEPLDGLFYPSYICPRKKQVEVARAAKAMKVRVFFAGKAQGEYPEYARIFERELDNEYAVWLGEIRDRRRLAALYRGAWGTFLASDFDNQGIILLESLACGRPVMGPDLPSLRTFFGDRISYCSGADSRNFYSELRDFDGFCRSGGRQDMQVAGWDEIGRRLFKVYNNIIDGTCARRGEA